MWDILTYNVELDRLGRGQVDDLELLSFCEVPLSESPSELGDALGALRRSGLVVRGQVLDSLQNNHVWYQSASRPRRMRLSGRNSPQPRRCAGSHRHHRAARDVLEGVLQPPPPS